MGHQDPGRAEGVFAAIQVCILRWFEYTTFLGNLYFMRFSACPYEVKDALFSIFPTFQYILFYSHCRLMMHGTQVAIPQVLSVKIWGSSYLIETQYCRITYSFSHLHNLLKFIINKLHNLKKQPSFFVVIRLTHFLSAVTELTKTNDLC